MENEELKCFYRAAELGCPDIKVIDGKPVLLCPDPTLRIKQKFTISVADLPHENPRINRYAADVCAGWWYSLWSKYPEDADLDLQKDCLDMKFQAHEFRRKYGST